MARAVLAILALCGVPAAVRAEQVPAGTVLEIRLQEGVSTYASKRGDALKGVLIAPVRAKDGVLLPLGAEVEGKVADVNRVGVGFIHETASMVLEFQQVRLPGGAVVPIRGRVKEVDNARERVDAGGRIKGIRATGTISHQLGGFIATGFGSDPLLFGFGFITSLGLLRFPESNIHYAAGTELFYVLTAPAEAPLAPEPPPVPIAATPAQQEALAKLIRSLPFRTATPKGTPSDITNLLFIGTEDEVKTAFERSGWAPTAGQDATSTYRTIRSIVEVQEYREAPMSLLVLDGRAPLFTFQKGLNTFARRHHLRVFKLPATWEGREVWTSSSTHDIDIAFSKEKKTFIHVIDENIDNERNKVVNDFMFAGCVEKVDLIHRAWIPRDAKNSTGDRLLTDGRLAAIDLKPCDGPPPPKVFKLDPMSRRGNLLTRSTRQLVLTTRNDLIRNNLVWQGISGIRALARAKNAKPRGERPERTLGIENDVFFDDPGDPFVLDRAEAATPYTPASGGSARAGGSEGLQPRGLELSVSGGWGRFPGRHISDVFVLDFNQNPEEPDAYGLPLDAGRGFTLDSRLTFNTFRYFSQEVFYSSSFQDIVLGELGATGSEAFRINQIGYNFLVNLAPNGSRFRPYVAAGPAVMTFHIGDIVASKTSGAYRFGLKKFGIIRSGFTAAGRKPLEGGLIFKPALSYGGGLKIRLSNLLLLRFDYRTSWVDQPDFFSASQDDLLEAGAILPIQDITGRLHHQRFTIGLGITF